MPRKLKRINHTTYEADFERGRVEVGDIASVGFIPSAKFFAFENETSLKVTYDNKPFAHSELAEEVDKIVLTDTVDVEFYPLDEIGGQAIPGFEMEVVLHGKPASNVINFDIETQDLNFYYQPELTQAEIDAGAHRPDHVVGSYAVYHATRGQMHKSKTEAEKYQAGKAFHIYRPKVVDANGDWVGGELKIDAGVMSITIPRRWLNDAVYPVRVDPTFGYTTAGGTSFQTAGTTIYNSWHAGVDGDATSISIYASDIYGVAKVKGALYERTATLSGSLISNSDTSETTISSAQWYTVNCSGSPSLVSTKNYWISGRGTAQQVMVAEGRLYYDSADADKSGTSSITGFDADWPSTQSLTGQARVYSFYCTYEEVSGVKEGGSESVVSVFAEGSGSKVVPAPILTAAQEGGSIRVSWTY